MIFRLKHTKKGENHAMPVLSSLIKPENHKKDISYSHGSEHDDCHPGCCAM
jgi:hypothetical protein